MSKSQEQRVKDAVAELRRRTTLDERRQEAYFAEEHAEVVARAILEAADREQPKWPTDETIEAYRKAAGYGVIKTAERTSRDVERDRAGIRAALLADPIIKAALGYVSMYRNERDFVGPPARCLIDAVNEAGL